MLERLRDLGVRWAGVCVRGVEDHLVRGCADLRADLVRRLTELGFRFVTLDLEGFRSGSLNTLVSVENKRLFANP